MKLGQPSLVVLLAAWLAACGPPLAETPIERDVFVRDLLAAAEGKPGKPPTEAVREMRVRSEVPAGAILRLEGRIWRRHPQARGAGPITFSVAAGDRTLFKRRMRTRKKSARFTAEVPVGDLAGGEPVELVLGIEGARPDYGAGSWKNVTLHRRVATPRQEASRGRNLLFMVVDTWRADRCSLYGYPRPTTPHLDELAADALVFDHAFSPSAWTSPATASLLTGLYPVEHRVIHGEPLKQAFTTLAETLQAAGFTTFAVSANPLISPQEGYDQGFETFRHRPWDRAEEVNEAFLDWLDGSADLRWLAYLHYIDPHDPYAAPGPAGKAFTDPGYDGVFRRPKALNELFHSVNFGQPPAHPVSDRDLAQLGAAYDGEILYWDLQLGRLVAELRRRGLLDRTVIILTSDHGEELAEHGMFKHGHQLYDESVRVPLVLRAPGRVHPGRRRAQVETRGVLRAALQLMGLGPAPEPGDLLEVADGDRWPAFSHTKIQPGPKKRRRAVVAAVRDTDWKLIRRLDSGRDELFHLASDPGENVDLAARRGDLVQEYRELLDRWLERGAAAGDPEPLEPPDPELMEKLEALGYIQ